MTYQVNEIFDSIQGEGFFTGTPATFIRLQGCTVGCSWCDSGPVADETWGRFTNGLTRNTWGIGGMRMTLDEILDKVNRTHVVITGGEPTMYNLDSLIDGVARRFPDKPVTVQLETSGQNGYKGKLIPDWVTWSPKQNLNFEGAEAIRLTVDEVKFVVDTNLEWSTVKKIVLEQVELRMTIPWIYLMPEGCPPSDVNIKQCLSWLKSFKEINGISIEPRLRFGDRLQYRLGIR